MAQEKQELKKKYTGSYVNALDVARSKGQVLNITHLPSSRFVTLTAFVDQWNDSFSSNWNRESVYGRMDTIQNFQNTQRVISVSFKSVAASKAEAKLNLRSASELAQFLYPTYKDLSDGVMNGFTISGAPILSVKYMNLITESDGSALAGTIDGLDHSFDLEAGFFEESGQIYPKVINLSFTFHPLHKNTQGYLASDPLLSINDGFPYTNSGYSASPPTAFDVAADDPESSGATPEQQEAEQNQVLNGTGGIFDTLYGD
jgi:hypothetical protein